MTGAVGTVTGAVGSVTGAVGSVTGNVGGNVVGSVGSVTGAVGSVTGAVGSVTGNVGGNVVGSVASVTGAVGSVAANGITAASIATDAITSTGVAASAASKVANQTWDTTASGHVTSGTFGQALGGIRAGTAQAGAATSITLDAGASAVNSFYVNDLVLITGGTGAGQVRFITAYLGSTKVATVAAWATNPDNTSVFVILPFDAIPGATAPTASQNAVAVWDELIAGHLGAGSTGEKLNNAGAAGVPPTVAQITNGVWDEPVSNHNTHGTMGPNRR